MSATNVAYEFFKKLFNRPSIRKNRFVPEPSYVLPSGSTGSRNYSTLEEVRHREKRKIRNKIAYASRRINSLRRR